MITSSANPAVKAARKLARRHGRTRGADELLVEGPQAVTEAGPFLRRLFVTPEAEQRAGDVLAQASAAGAEIVRVSEAVLADIATTVTPQGVIGVAALPGHALEAAVAEASLIVVLDQVRDPGNAGTAIRTADAAGADAVVLTRGSVDPRNAKAVRASAGSLFHLPVVDDVPAGEVIAACRAAGLDVIAAAADATTDHTAADLSGRVALVFGNEAHGVERHVLDACDTAVRIPMRRSPRPGFSGAAESLNLAATVAVLTFEAARQGSRGGREHAGP